MHSNLIVLLGITTLFIAFSGCIATDPDDFHAHADFVVYILGQKYDFGLPQFVSDENNSLSERVHIHDLSGNIMHMHARDITLKEFFQSLGWKYENGCIDTIDYDTFCNGGNIEVPDSTLKLKLYVNGELNIQNENYIPKDLDRILITYGNETPEQIQQQINSITDESCIQSGKCPERGSPSNESGCTTAGGCSVDLNNLRKTCMDIPIMGNFCWA